jgi:CHAT domain/PDZ domain
LALGDPVFDRTESSPEPGPLPDHGLLVDLVVPGSNAARHDVRPGDVLLAYNGTLLRKREDLKANDEPDKRIEIEIWRAGQVLPREVGPGKLGVVLDVRPAAAAIQDQRRFNQVLAAARSGSEHFDRLPGTRYEVEALAQLFESVHRPARVLTGSEASEAVLDKLSGSGALGQFGLVHLATPGLIDESIPQNSAVILTQTDLPDPLAQVLNHKPVFDGRIAMREIQRSWDLKAELVTISACETAGGPLCRRRAACRVHPGIVDVGGSERLRIALEGRRHGDVAPDAAVLFQHPGSPRRIETDVQGAGAGRREKVAP